MSMHCCSRLCLPAVLAALIWAAATGYAQPRGPGLSSAAQASDAAARMLEAGSTGSDVQQLQAQVESAIRKVAEDLAPGEGPTATMPTEPGDGPITNQGTRTSVPEQAGEESVLPSGEWAAGRLQGGTPVSGWQPALPPSELKEISDAFSEGRLPAYYRQRLQAYGRRLAEDGATSTADRP